MLQELCEGGTLDEAIRRPWMYPPGNDAASREDILIKLSTQIARGLEYIHSHGHIHGDLSSNNVLLSLPPDHSYPAHQTHANSTADASEHRPDDTSDTPSYSDPRMWENVTLKISDFGRSKEKEFGSCRTDSIGTVTFMPPETLTAGSLQPSADIYSYGVILIQLWAGKLPYQNYNFAQIIFEASQGRTPPVPEDMVAPRCIKDIIRQCLSPFSSERPTATEILGMFNGVARISVAEEDEEGNE
jgi:serine/threonine protein kinase